LKSLILILSACAVVAAPLSAQKKPTAAQLARDSADRAAAIALAAIPTGRLSWTSDRRPLRVGDLLTIVVDEQTVASETSTSTAHLTRSQTGTMSGAVTPTKLQSLGLGYDARSDAGSAAARSGDLTATLSVRVVAIEPGGIARISGQKFVSVDGRKQEVRLAGAVRAEDVAADNTVGSSRVADAVISYQGKKIGPTTGILGKIVAILWP
jgi:flagellar L-ring protein FlgH